MPGIIPRTIAKSSVVRSSSINSETKLLDPFLVLESLLSKITDLNAPFAVNLSDNTKSISMTLATFTSREYPVIDNVIKFGVTKLKLDELKVSVSYDLAVNPGTQ